ncbi:MAG: Acyltransferase [Gemmataceae bacterium]|nr:Acyltransferase [Gemmataceae bacterium]
MNNAIRPTGVRPDIESLTSLRGLAAGWVVLYHFGDDLAFTRAASPLLRMGNMAVPCFFVLSGFVLSYNYLNQFPSITWRSYLKFLSLRFARVYPVHLFTLLVLLAMLAVALHTGMSVQHLEDGYGVHDFVLNLFLVHTWVPYFRLNWNYPSWSISSEWFAYILFPLMAIGLNRLGRRWLAVALGLGWGGMMAVYQTSFPLPFRELLVVLPTFFIGCILGRWLLSRPVGGGAIPGGLAADAAVIAVLVAPSVLPVEWAVATMLTAFVVIVGGLAAAGGRCSRLWRWGPVLYLGEVSYSLYMTHALAHRVCIKVLPAERYAGSGLAAQLLVAAGYFGLVAAATLSTYYLVEKPFRRWGRRLADRTFSRVSGPRPG